MSALKDIEERAVVEEAAANFLFDEYDKFVSLNVVNKTMPGCNWDIRVLVHITTYTDDVTRETTIYRYSPCTETVDGFIDRIKAYLFDELWRAARDKAFKEGKIEKTYAEVE